LHEYQRVVVDKDARTWNTQWVNRISCHRFAANAIRLQLHALAYNLANFLRTPALPEAVKRWSMPTLRDRLVKIGAKVVRHRRSAIFQKSEVIVTRTLFQQILTAVLALSSPLPTQC
jgi:Transposase DDE domain group 1